MLEFFKKEEVGQAVGLDIGPSSIKVVQLRREKEKITLDTYGEIPLGPYAGMLIGQAVSLGEEKTLQAVQDLFKEAKITARNTVIAIDPSASYVSLIKVPKVEDDQLRTRQRSYWSARAAARSMCRERGGRVEQSDPRRVVESVAGPRADARGQRGGPVRLHYGEQ